MLHSQSNRGYMVSISLPETIVFVMEKMDFEQNRNYSQREMVLLQTIEQLIIWRPV